jgi:AraC-like DNA-binding protein
LHSGLDFANKILEKSIMSLYHILSSLGSFLAITLGINLILLKSKVSQQNIFLGLKLLAYALWLLPGLFDALNILNDLPHIIRLNFFAGFLIGPLSYFYVKLSTNKEPLNLKECYVHFIPFVISIFYFLPFLFKSGEEKIIAYQNLITNGIVSELPSTFIIKILLISYYMFLSFKIIQNYIRQNYMLNGSNLNTNLQFYYWLHFYNFSTIIPLLFVSIFSFAGIAYFTVIVPLISLVSIIFIIYITYILRPNFFHIEIGKLIESNVPNKQQVKYQNSYIQDDQKDTYLNKILSYMKTHKPYVNSELTLKDLSSGLGLPSHIISQIINEKLNLNFNDFINQYRINDIKEKLADPNKKHYTILALAYETGFNSKTAFYDSFKKFVGMSPSEYKNQIMLDCKEK